MSLVRYNFFPKPCERRANMTYIRRNPLKQNKNRIQRDGYLPISVNASTVFYKNQPLKSNATKSVKLRDLQISMNSSKIDKSYLQLAHFNTTKQSVCKRLSLFRPPSIIKPKKKQQVKGVFFHRKNILSIPRLRQ